MTDLQQQAKDMRYKLLAVADAYDKFFKAKSDEITPMIIVRQSFDLFERIERGELVEVVTCGECRYHGNCGIEAAGRFTVVDGCLHGRRKDNGNSDI